jgi:hypothetical protein
MPDVDRITLNGKVPKHRHRHVKSIQAENYSWEPNER